MLKKGSQKFFLVQVIFFLGAGDIFGLLDADHSLASCFSHPKCVINPSAVAPRRPRTAAVV
jgi:hypothetical protein